MKKLSLIILALICCSALAQPLELPAYGFGDLSTIPVPQSYIEENYIGDAPLEAILNHRNNDKYWRIARSVGLLDMVLTRNGSTLRSVCTATLISNDLILTNAHCIPGKDANSQVVAATLHMGYDQKGLETVRYPVNTQPIDTDFDLDYTVLSVGDNPGARFGYVTLNMRAPVANERLFIIQHPEGQAKQISRNCIIFSSAGITGVEIRHRCDTRGGSSGSLVFAESDGSVVGLHFASSFQDSNPPPPAERFNLAKRLDAIFRDSAYLPEQLSSAPPANPTPTPAPPTPAPVPAQPVVQQGYLSVTSSPSGATVSVDGIIVGTTPLRSLAYDVGTYQLRLSYNGYEVHSENIRISAGQSLQRTITLRAEAPKQGYLSVTSSPSGATVSVDGTVIGTTPLRNRAYDVGNYQLRLSYSGYETHSATIGIRAGQNIQHTIVLRAEAPKQGYLSVTSSPSGATVSVDGTVIGTTPLSNRAYDVGTYQLRLSYSGYEMHSENIRISAGQSLQRTITLRAEAPKQGYLSVTSSPSGATVSVDGTVIGTTPLRNRAYDVGTYQLRLSYSDYETHSENIRIRAGQSLRRNISLQAVAPKQGYLSVSSSPSGAGVAIDGRVIGTTPLNNRAYDVGNYQLRLYHNGYQSYSESINIRAGQSLQRNITLRANQPELIRTADELVRRARQGGTLRLAAGTFRLNSSLELSGDVQLIGQGYQQTRIVSSASGYVVRYTGGGTFAAQGVGFEHTGDAIADVVRVENGTLDIDSCQFTKGKDDGSFQGGVGLRITGRTQGKVSRSLFNHNGLHGIRVSDNAQPRLEQNRLHDNTQAGIAYLGSAGGSAVSNESYGNGLHGISVVDNAQPRLEQNRLHDNTQSGIVYFHQSGGSARNNQSYNNGINGIYVASTANPSLSNNTTYGNRQGDIVDRR